VDVRMHLHMLVRELTHCVGSLFLANRPTVNADFQLHH